MYRYIRGAGTVAIVSLVNHGAFELLVPDLNSVDDKKLDWGSARHVRIVPHVQYH